MCEGEASQSLIVGAQRSDFQLTGKVLLSLCLKSIEREIIGGKDINCPGGGGEAVDLSKPRYPEVCVSTCASGASTICRSICVERSE